MNYLYENPVKAGFVWRAKNYRYRSAKDYYTIAKGLLETNR